MVRLTLARLSLPKYEQTEIASHQMGRKRLISVIEGLCLVDVDLNDEFELLSATRRWDEGIEQTLKFGRKVTEGPAGPESRHCVTSNWLLLTLTQLRLARGQRSVTTNVSVRRIPPEVISCGQRPNRCVPLTMAGLEYNPIE